MTSALPSVLTQDDASISNPPSFNFSHLDLIVCRKLWRQTFWHFPRKHMPARFIQRVLTHEAQCKIFGGPPTGLKRAFERFSKQQRYKKYEPAKSRGKSYISVVTRHTSVARMERQNLSG